MSSSAGWAALAGFANTLGGRLQADHELEQKQKLMQMQQDAEMKRQKFLEKYKSDLDEARDASKHEREAGDVVGAARNPETGAWEGRTRDGSMIQLGDTSEGYKAALAAKRALGNKKTEGQIDLNDARVVETGARTGLIGKQGANIDSIIDKRNQPSTKEDPISKDIRSTDTTDIDRQQKEVNARRAEMLKANPQADPATLPTFDPDQAAQAAAARVYKQYGAEKAKSVLSGIQGIKADAPPQQQSPTQPGAPSMESLMQQANDAIKRGAPQDKVEARLKEAMAKYGYNPQPVQ
jgi:hypothetical protein